MSSKHGTCQDCRHFAPLEQQCRRNPPQAAIVPSPNGQPVVVGMWPSVKAEQWCGEFVSDKQAMLALAH